MHERHWKRVFEELYADILKMRELLEWLDKRGGLGQDVHERIRKVLDAD